MVYLRVASLFLKTLLSFTAVVNLSSSHVDRPSQNRKKKNFNMVSSGLLLWIENGLTLHKELSILDYELHTILFNCVIT